MSDMISFQSIEEYYEILRQTKKEYKPIYTNNFMEKKEIIKLIQENRLSYEKVDGGIIIYKDEIRYYQIYLYLNVKYDFVLRRNDKPIVVNIIYSGESKSETIKTLEEKFEYLGMKKKDHMILTEGNADEILKKTEVVYATSVKLMQRAGMQLKMATRPMLKDIRHLMEITEEIPYYQLPYESDDELMEEGLLMCIVDKDDNVLGFIRRIYTETQSMGWIIVDEKIRNKGFTVALSMASLNHTKQKGLKPCGWIAEQNNKSLVYHTKLGCVCKNRYLDYWFLEE